MNTRLFSVALAVSFVVGQVILHQWWEIHNLKREIRLLESAKDIVEDQCRELEMSVSVLTSERDSVATRHFVMGVLESSRRPEYYNGVWHDGYDHGMQTYKYTNGEVSPEGLPQ